MYRLKGNRGYINLHHIVSMTVSQEISRDGKFILHINMVDGRLIQGFYGNQEVAETEMAWIVSEFRML